MPKIHAETALLPDGWAENVLVEIDDIGRIAKVNTNVTDVAAKFNVSCLLPAPVNAHSHAFQRAMAGLRTSQHQYHRQFLDLARVNVFVP